MLLLVAFPPQTGAATRRAFGGRLFRAELEQHQAPGIADAIVGQLDDAGVAALTIAKLRRDFVEQLLHHRLVPTLVVLDELLILIGDPAIVQLRRNPPTREQGVLPRFGDELLRKRANLLGLGQGRADLAMLEEALHQVAAHRLAVLSIAAELPAADSVTGHDNSSSVVSCPLSVAAFTTDH
jgi:hypothetical protein